MLSAGGSVDAPDLGTAAAEASELGIRTILVEQPYKVAGRWYVPREEPGYDATGTASWYGGDFHGRKTANGEIFDMNALTAAHPTLPLPSYAYVTHLGNGRTVLVRINDRGPYAHDRIIDLSRGVARALGSDALPVLEKLLERKENVVAVFCAPDKTGKAEDPLKVFAREKKLPVHQPASWKTPEALELMKSFNADVCMMAYVLLFVPQPVLHWRMDAAAWTGAPNEVLDASGNNLHGRAFNGANTALLTPAIRVRPRISSATSRSG